MQVMRKHVLSLRNLSFGTRLLIVVLIFSAQEALIIYFRGWDNFAAILILVGVLTCWVFRWQIAYGILSCFLVVYIVVDVVYVGWSVDAVTGVIAGIIINGVLVGSIGALRVAVDRANDFHKIKDQFLANLNHDIRTPLAGVVGSLDLLKVYGERLTQAERQLFLEQAIFSCDEIERLTGNIRMAMRATDDVPPPQRRVFRLDVAVSNLLRYVYTFDHPLADLHIQEGIEVFADTQQTQQVLRNLLHNAFKYAPAGTPISVHVGVFQWVEGFAYICVGDKGSGIPLKDMDKLFQKFSRIERSKHVDGSGLGLYNCRRLVENMGGQIWVDSTGIDGEGSRFFFTLPLAEKHRQQETTTGKHRSIDRQ